VQTRVGPADEGERRLIRFADESMPPRAHVGLAIHDRDWSYPFFGGGLDRTVRFVASTGAVPADVDWLVVASGRQAPGPGWRRVVRTADGWAVFARRS
jgi:hypothetical protein